MPSSIAEFIQPQHIWPYIQHNFIHQSQIQSQGYHINGNNQAHHISPPNSISENDNLQPQTSLQQNGAPQQQQQQQPATDLQDDNRLHPRDKQQLIAKPLASRPAPFIHHGLNHPHLHSLLAHCRNPYMTGKTQIAILKNGS